MKVLLVERGEPYSFFGASKVDAGDISDCMPFLSIERIAEIPRNSDPPGFLHRYDAFVLPSEVFLEMEETDRLAPAIAYGVGEAAFACFEAGAVDFMRSGWAMPELEARLYQVWQPTIECGELTIALCGATLSIKGHKAGSKSSSCVLTLNESAMLRTLFSSPGKVISPGFLSDRSGLAEPRSRALAMRMIRLRAKLAEVHPLLAESLKSVRGRGYSWCP